MGWDNPPVPWREFERRLSWRQEDKRAQRDEPADDAVRPVTRLPAAGGSTRQGPVRRGGGRPASPFRGRSCTVTLPTASWTAPPPPVS